MPIIEEVAQSACNVNISISRQGLDQRFTPEAAAFLEQVLNESINQVIAANAVETDLLNQFTGVYVVDSTIVILPDALEVIWKGCEGSAVKITVCWGLLTRQLLQVYLHHADEHDTMQCNRYGQIAAAEWERTPILRSNVSIPAYVVMPNHVHAIIVIHEPTAPTIHTTDHRNAIICGYKGTVTRTIRQLPDAPEGTLWQRNYHDRVIWNQREYDHITAYILTNPARWQQDSLYL